MNAEFVTRSPEETQELGRHLGELAHPGDVLLLVGDLGAGKTCLTQGIAWGLGSKEYAASPSFVIMRELRGRLTLYHMDLYRLDRIEEIADLGLDDYLYGRGVCAIEWAEKGAKILPAEHMLIKIDYMGDNERCFEFVARGDRYKKVVERLKRFSPDKG
jgi:tRNA threonylcarbamoyladenosine biosynthesis protein TsaE